MEALRALLEEKKKSAAGQFGGRGYVRQADIEGARLKRLREEEVNELSHKVQHIQSVPLSTYFNSARRAKHGRGAKHRHEVSRSRVSEMFIAERSGKHVWPDKLQVSWEAHRVE